VNGTPLLAAAPIDPVDVAASVTGGGHVGRSRRRG